MEDLDCDHCGRTTYWCHCDTHPVGTTPQAQAAAVAFLASIGVAFLLNDDDVRLTGERYCDAE